MGIAPVAPFVRDAYGLGSDFWPNFLQMMFPFFSICMMPVAIYKYRDQQVSNTIRMAAASFVIGAWTRYGIVNSGNFFFVIIGSILVACAQPFFVISQSILIKKWFPEKE